MFLATSLPEDQMEALAEYFKVFSEPSRLAVLEATGLSQALVSKHLKLLTIAGVVQRRPEGSLVFYEVIDMALPLPADGSTCLVRRSFPMSSHA